MKKKLIFVGSRSGMSTLAAVPESLGIEILGILDSHYWGNTTHIAGIPVIGDERWLLDPDNLLANQWKETCTFFPANWHDGSQTNGLDDLRLARIDLMDQAQVDVCNLIHPSAAVFGLTSKYGNFKIGKGVLIQANSVVLADNVEIGDYCAFEIGSVVTHTATIGRNVLASAKTFIYNCNIQDNAYLGIFSRLNAVPGKNKILQIGKNVTVWNSAEVTKNIPDDHFYTSDSRILKKTLKKEKHD